jgi:plasmid stabilization system protein ParE
VLPIEWKASAAADLLEILDFISLRHQKAAQDLFERIEHDLEHAAEHPYLYKQSPKSARPSRNRDTSQLHRFLSGHSQLH